MLEVVEPRNFSVLDVENLRLHYAETLRHWLHALRRGGRHGGANVRRDVRADVAALFDRLAGGFHHRALQLFQLVLARPGLNEIPWTRAGCMKMDRP